MLYPPQCISCRAETDSDFELCKTCWENTEFISGTVCDACGTPLPGESGDTKTLCDSCICERPLWDRGRAALKYGGTARKMILALKYGDRSDLCVSMARWMTAAAGDLIQSDTIIVPVPLHRFRFFRRRYNQAALLAARIAGMLDRRFEPNILHRCRATPIQDGLGREERINNVKQAFEIKPKKSEILKKANILIVDDVMTTGATLSACTDACLTSGAETVNVLVLARVAHND